jgi:NTP pyrophosphatase (non-canonical NTP hydrolase)
MRLTKFQEQALRTMNTNLPLEKQRQMCLYGMVGELGEIADHLKKHLFHKHKLDVVHFNKEIGDLLWYVVVYASTVDDNLEMIDIYQIPKTKMELLDIIMNIHWLIYQLPRSVRSIDGLIWKIVQLARYLRISIDQAMNTNIEKLQARYPDGFSPEASINRVI